MLNSKAGHDNQSTHVVEGRKQDKPVGEYLRALDSEEASIRQIAHMNNISPRMDPGNYVLRVQVSLEQDCTGSVPKISKPKDDRMYSIYS